MDRDGREQVVVVGGGPCGLALARQLGRELGSAPLVLDRAQTPASSWRGRYEGFRLNTCGYWSHLPGLRIPLGAGRWPSREAMIRYFDDYVRSQGIRLELGVEVERIERDDAGWAVRTDRGTYSCAAVVVATGNYRRPVLPAWEGITSYRGQVLHSGEYRNAWPFRGQDVLVVGSGNSAADIAVQLADGAAGRVLLAIRTPPHLVRRSTLGVPPDAFTLLADRMPNATVDRLGALLRQLTFGDLTAYGFETPPMGIHTTVRDTGRIPTLGEVLVHRVRQGRIEIVSAVDGFDADKVRLVDGELVTVETVIAATGFRPGLEDLVGGLDVLERNGHPVANGVTAALPGLWFAGFAEPFTGPLRSFRLQATPMARTIAEYVSSQR